jgi:hypothetical protein
MNLNYQCHNCGISSDVSYNPYLNEPFIIKPISQNAVSEKWLVVLPNDMLIDRGNNRNELITRMQIRYGLTGGWKCIKNPNYKPGFFQKLLGTY